MSFHQPHLVVYEQRPHWSVALRLLPQLSQADIRVVHSLEEMHQAVRQPGLAMSVWEAAPSTMARMSAMLCDLESNATTARFMVCTHPQFRHIDHVWRTLGALHIAYATRLLPLAGRLLQSAIQAARVEEPDFRRRIWSSLPWKNFAREATEFNYDKRRP